MAPSERLVEQAIALIAESEVAPSSAAAEALAALARWRGRSAEHEAAAREARQRWDALGGLAGGLRTHFAGAEGLRSATTRSRRRALLSVAAVLGVGLVGGRGAWWYWQAPLFTASYDTAAAQLRRASLPDGAEPNAGSALDLAPRSALQVSLYRRRRAVVLERGEVRFDVASDPPRPFEVSTRQARIEVVGTVFTVRDRGGPMTVGVEQGQVRVMPLALQAPDAGGQAVFGRPVELRAGQLVEVEHGRVSPVRTVAPDALSAGRDGWLVFDNAPLRDALETLNAYSARPLVVPGPELEGLRLSGRFRAGDPAGLLASLPSILPLVVRTLPDGRVELRRR